MDLKYIIETEYEHPYYNECQEVVKDAMVIHTQDREKHAEELRRYRPSEPDELFKQRLRLHNPILAAIIQPTYSYLSYIYRADGIKRIHRTESPKREDIERNFEQFHAGMDVHKWLYEAVTYYNKVDPNAVIGLDKKEEVSETGEVLSQTMYPVEFPSDQVISRPVDDNGKLKSLTARRLFDAKDKAGREVKGLKSYFHYFPGGWEVAYEIGKGDATHPKAGAENGFTQVTYTVGKKPVQYWYKIGQNFTTEVPFFCVGAEWHPEHRNKVFCTFTHDSTGLLKGILKDDNFLSVHKVVHCWAEKDEYVKRCTHVNDQGQSCEGGYYNGVRDKNHVCKACNGTGKISTPTEQTVRQFAWPDNADDFVELAKTKHYHERPLNIAEFYVEEIKRGQELVFATTYNQNNTRPVAGHRTAEEIKRNHELINNKLAPIANRIEDGWELFHRVAHQYYLITDGMVEMTHPSDFKTATVDELIKQYNEAIQLPQHVRGSITDDILNKQYRNFPELKEDIKAFESWKPWRDKSMEEAIVIASNRAPDDFFRVLWENWTMVVEWVKNDLSKGTMQPVFYLLSRDKQLEALRRGVDFVLGLTTYIEASEPEPLFTEFAEN